VSKNINYLPHKGYFHRSTKDDDWENYINNLSSSVSKACDKFFEKRGMTFNDSSLSFFQRNKKSPDEKSPD